MRCRSRDLGLVDGGCFWVGKRLRDLLLRFRWNNRRNGRSCRLPDRLDGRRGRVWKRRKRRRS